MDKTLEWIPTEWIGLFKVLLLKQSTLPALEKWYQEAAGSCYAETLSWSQLCSALTFNEPQVLKDQLVFVPRLVSLSVQQQQILLCFLEAHKDCLSQNSINALCDCLDTVQDSWIKIMVKRMKQRQTLSTSDYKISEKNKSQYDELISSLAEKSKERASIWSPMATCNAKVMDTDDCDSMPASQPVPIDVATPQLLSQGTPSSQRVRLSLGTPKTSKRKLLMDDIEASPSKMVASQTMTQSSCDTSNLDISSSQLIDVGKLERLGLQLVERWEGRDVSQGAQDPDVLYKITVKQMASLCESVGGLSEEGLAAACQHMISVSSQLPHSHAVCFAEHTLMPKLRSLKQTCSRSLLHSFMTFSKSFSRPAIEGVLLPAVKDEGFCSSKADLVNKVAKDGLDASLKEELLKQIAEQCNHWGEPVLLVLQTLLDSKLKLDEQCISSFVKCLERNSFTFKSNLKFGKLVLALVNKYPKQLLPCHQPSLQATVMNHGTFLKKSLTASLNKLFQ